MADYSYSVFNPCRDQTVITTSFLPVPTINYMVSINYLEWYKVPDKESYSYEVRFFQNLGISNDPVGSNFTLECAGFE